MMMKRTAILTDSRPEIRQISFTDCMGLSLDELLRLFHSDDINRDLGESLLSDCLCNHIEAEKITLSELTRPDGNIPDRLVTYYFNNIAPKWEIPCELWNRLLDAGTQIVPMPLGLRAWEDGRAYISEDVQNVLARIAERSPIGVIGEYTAEELARFGIKNSVIIGLPSVFADRRPAPVRVPEKIQRLHFHFNQYYRDFYQWPIRFYEKSMRLYWYMERIFRTGQADILFSLQHPFLRELTGFIEINGGCEPVSDFVMNTCRFHFDADSWKEAVSRTDFAMGTETDGAVISLLAGVPSLLLTIDNRTAEIARTHRLPSMPVEKFDGGKDLMFYLEHTDMEGFYQAYDAGCDRFKSYCLRSGLSLR